MATKKRLFSMISSLLLGAVPLGARAFAQSAAADDPTSAAAADATAQQYRDEADWLKSLGGVGYKTGLVQRAEANAAKYDADAAALRAPEAPPPMTPEAEHYAKLADQYKAIVGRERRGDETFADETFVTEIVAADHSGPVHSAPTSAAGLVTSQGTSDGVVGAAASVVSCALRSSASARWTSPVL